MTGVFVHDLQAKAQPLLNRLTEVLRSSSDPAAHALLSRAVIEPHTKPRLVVTGQYSAGKSTLIKALTDGAVNPLIGADISTDAVTEYDWDGLVSLIDTPGVKAGLRHHDELAKEAIGNSDFILFVVNVELFDDAGRDYIREVAHKEGKYDQLIIVVTQIAKKSAPLGYREQHVREALGTVTYLPPLLEVDAMWYLESLDDDDQELRRDSCIDALRTAINATSEKNGANAMYRQPFQLIRQICDEAQSLFVSDPAEQQALAVLANQRRAITERRNLIDREVASAEAAFKNDSRTDVLWFVDSATSLGDADATQDAFNAQFASLERELQSRLNRHAETFGTRIDRLCESQMDTLAAQMIEIGDSHRAAALLRYEGGVEVAANVHVSRGDSGSMQGGGSQFGWMRDMQHWLQQGRKFWGAGDGVKAAAGGPGHKIVLDVGHRFGVKFEPWQAVRWADKIGKAAKAGGFVLNVAIAGGEAYLQQQREHRAQLEAHRRHSAFVTEVMGYVDEIAVSSRKQLSDIIDPPLDEYVAGIDRQQAEILDASAGRSQASAELEAVAREADHILECAVLPTVVKAT